MKPQPHQRSVSRMLLFLVLTFSALAPVGALAFSLLAQVCGLQTLSWRGLVLYGYLIPDLCIVFGAGLVSFWITSRGGHDVPLRLWVSFPVGALALMVGFPAGTVTGVAAVVALCLMKARSHPKGP